MEFPFDNPIRSTRSAAIAAPPFPPAGDLRGPSDFSSRRRAIENNRQKANANATYLKSLGEYKPPGMPATPTAPAVPGASPQILDWVSASVGPANGQPSRSDFQPGRMSLTDASGKTTVRQGTPGNMDVYGRQINALRAANIRRAEDESEFLADAMGGRNYSLNRSLAKSADARANVMNTSLASLNDASAYGARKHADVILPSLAAETDSRANLNQVAAYRTLDMLPFETDAMDARTGLQRSLTAGERERTRLMPLFADQELAAGSIRNERASRMLPFEVEGEKQKLAATTAAMPLIAQQVRGATLQNNAAERMLTQPSGGISASDMLEMDERLLDLATASAKAKGTTVTSEIEALQRKYGMPAQKRQQSTADRMAAVPVGTTFHTRGGQVIRKTADGFVDKAGNSYGPDGKLRARINPTVPAYPELSPPFDPTLAYGMSLSPHDASANIKARTGSTYERRILDSMP